MKGARGARGARGVKDAARVTTPAKARRRRIDDELLPTAGTPALLPPPQDLSVLRFQRAEDRLQGCPPVAAVRVRAGQDRAEPNYRGLRQEAARAGAGHQARQVPRALALRDRLIEDRRRTPSSSVVCRVGTGFLIRL